MKPVEGSRPPTSPTSSHDSTSKPTALGLLAVVCLAIVRRIRPEWTAVTVGEAARQEHVNPERVSRLCTRVQGVLCQILGKFTRKGRPPKDEAVPETEAENALLRELLGVARGVIAQVPMRKEAVRVVVVGAWLRLKAPHPSLTQQWFCDMLGVSPRTLRSWIRQTPSSPSPPPPPTSSQSQSPPTPTPPSTSSQSQSPQSQSQSSSPPPTPTSSQSSQSSSPTPTSSQSQSQSPPTPTPTPTPTSSSTRSPTPSFPPLIAEPTTPKRRQRGHRRRHFGFDVVLPDTQFAADTTDIRAFGVDLKLIAAQDVGGRDIDLFDDILIDETECADYVAQVATNALGDSPGAQLLTDQGTPYMAEKARAAYEQLQAEHAPQKEADPIGKATVERAFLTVKTIMAPFFELTNSIAATVPAFADSKFAIAVTTLMMTMALRAYQAGGRAARRACEARGGIDIEELTRAAQQHRERARADDRSARLLLTRIHSVYRIDTPLLQFIRNFRYFPLPVLRGAETDFAKQAHRDDIINRTAYFAHLCRNRREEFFARRAVLHQHNESSRRLDEQARSVQDQRAAWMANPASWLRDAFEVLSSQWQPDTGALLFGGAGVTVWIQSAVERLVELYGPQSAIHISLGALHRFAVGARDDLGDAGIEAIAAILYRHLPNNPEQTDFARSARSFADILRPTKSNARPPPDDSC